MSIFDPNTLLFQIYEDFYISVEKINARADHHGHHHIKNSPRCLIYAVISQVL